MPTYSAADIVGKTLIAKKPVAIKRTPAKSAPTVYTVATGGTVGVVYSWVNADGALWWMFYDANQKPYYTLHTPDSYNVKALTAQGTQSLEEIQEDKKQAESPVSYFLDKYFTPLLWIGGSYLALRLYQEYNKK